jgi:hypothetical protein
MNRTLPKKIELALILVLCAGILFGSEARCFDDSVLDALLDRTGRGVEIFWQQVASFACTELVTQEKIGKNNRTKYKEDSAFDYLALARVQENDLSVEELRMPKKKVSDKTDHPPLLATNGFPTLLLIFHPKYRDNYRYEMGSGCGENSGMICVRFEHISGMPSTCALQLRDRLYPLELRGTAWIDAESGSIQKMVAGLKSPMKDINIEGLSIEVTYQSQAFPSDPGGKWLPAAAVINVQTALQHWRNIHRYSEYKRFTVESLESKLH